MPGMYLLAFAGACVLVAMVPGVSTAIILRQTLRAGRGSGLAATLGNETGILLWGLAAAFGLSALLVASQLAYDVMRVIGAVVLVVMGAQSLWQARKGAAPPPEVATVAGWRGSYLAGVGTCLANPKAAVFMIAFYPQFVPAHMPLFATTAVLAALQVVLETGFYLALAAGVARAGGWLRRPRIRARLEAVSGTVLVGLGLRVAVASR
jgi:threonine/homoserine/homoserine lactone efflux protein